jgi:hypothetical protein
MAWPSAGRMPWVHGPVGLVGRDGGAHETSRELSYDRSRVCFGRGATLAACRAKQVGPRGPGRKEEHRKRWLARGGVVSRWTYVDCTLNSPRIKDVCEL